MRSGNRGQALVLFLFATVALLGLAALGIDVGYMHAVRHELQRSADAGALAGASALLDGNGGTPETRALAALRSGDYASRNGAAGSVLEPASDVSVAFPRVDRVSVDVSRTIPLFFSRPFLGPKRRIGARAVAQASVVSRNVRGLKPWAIPYPWEDLDGDGLYDPGETVHRDCPEGIVDRRYYFCPGSEVVLKIGTPYRNPSNPVDVPSLQQEPGHFFALDLDGSGAAGYRDAIKTERTAGIPVSLGDELPLETGNMVGPTIQGVGLDTDSLIVRDPDSAWDPERNLPHSDRYPLEEDAWMKSPRIVRIPVYDPGDALRNGKTGIVVAGFAGFWISGIDRHLGTVRGRFVPMQARGEAAGPSEGPATGPVLRTLRLVE